MEEIIFKKRGTGKTKDIIINSSVNKIPILVTTKLDSRVIKDFAKKLNLNIPEPIILNSNNDNARVKEVYVDNLDLLLNKLLPNFIIKKATINMD